MAQLKSLIIGSSLTLILCLVIISMALVMSDLQSVKADTASQPVLINVDNNVQYLTLQDAPPHRDITQQRLAPLQ